MSVKSQARELGQQRLLQQTRSTTARAARRLLLVAVDRGLFGLNPLQTHVVICGFPRSGSTLLHLMIRNSVRDVLTFSRERCALGNVQYELRNRHFMVTKRPDDLFRIQDIRNFYAHRHQASARFVVMLRDPRDVLVSKHARRPGQ